jgi:hypothetical protein
MEGLARLIKQAADVGLYITRWSPGDGKTRYRFSKHNADYFACTPIATVLGSRDARL